MRTTVQTQAQEMKHTMADELWELLETAKYIYEKQNLLMEELDELFGFIEHEEEAA